MSKIDDLLSRLRNLNDSRVGLDTNMQEAIDKVLTPEIAQQLEDIRLEFALPFEMLDKEIDIVEAEIKKEITSLGQSYRGSGYNVVFTPKRILWNSKALEGYAVAHPEINAFRTDGGPSVSIRKEK